MTSRNPKAAPRRGSVLAYTLIALTALTGFSSLAVDWGRVQMVKTQLHTAADAAARAGVSGLAIDAYTAVARAKATAAANLADGSAVLLNETLDIEVGTWNTSTRKFTKLTSFATPNAVRVIARRLTARGTGIPMSLATLVGHKTHDVQVESIAYGVPPINIDQNVAGSANPFLSGMPAGTMASLNNPHNHPDYAGTAANPAQSPLLIAIPINNGQVVNFETIGGGVRHDPNQPYYTPDGQLNDIGGNTAGSEHGIANMNCPINALVGVFLSDAQPDTNPTPDSLDFSTDASRDFKELRPQLQQMFFIGDGLDSSGNHQNFVAPKGATRLFLATWDFYEWNNNSGARVIRITRPEQILTVK